MAINTAGQKFFRELPPKQIAPLKAANLAPGTIPTSITRMEKPSASVAENHRPVPILTYHSLDDSGSVTSVAPADFVQHMRSLARRGFTGISLSELLDAWENKTTLPARPVVLTFDDGFANLLPHAAPLLSELKFRATLFVVSGRCGQTNDWPDQAPSIPRLPLLTWDELAQLAPLGWEIGAHTVTHRPLTSLSADEARREILESKTTIEQKLSRAVTTFAYPFGLMNAASRDCVRENFRAGCSVEFGTAAPPHDRSALPRLDVYYLRSPAIFNWFGTSAGGAYLVLRGAGRLLKTRLQGAPQ